MTCGERRSCKTGLSSFIPSSLAVGGARVFLAFDPIAADKFFEPDIRQNISPAVFLAQEINRVTFWTRRAGIYPINEPQSGFIDRFGDPARGFDHDTDKRIRVPGWKVDFLRRLGRFEGFSKPPFFGPGRRGADFTDDFHGIALLGNYYPFPRIAQLFIERESEQLRPVFDKPDIGIGIVKIDNAAFFFWFFLRFFFFRNYSTSPLSAAIITKTCEVSRQSIHSPHLHGTNIGNWWQKSTKDYFRYNSLTGASTFFCLIFFVTTSPLFL
jgi:hypothetical protein